MTPLLLWRDRQASCNKDHPVLKRSRGWQNDRGDCLRAFRIHAQHGIKFDAEFLLTTQRALSFHLLFWRIFGTSGTTFSHEGIFTPFSVDRIRLVLSAHIFVLVCERNRWESHTADLHYI